MKQRTLGYFALAALVTCTLLAGCNQDPRPSYRDAQEIEQTQLAVTKMGEPFEVDGCTVQAHRVTVSGALPNFTLATAKCPTAQVSATTQNCGKNCTSEAVKVEYAVPAPALSPAEAQLATKARELRAQVDALNKELKDVEKKLNTR